VSVYDQSYRVPIDTGGIREHFVAETRQKFADAGYDLSIDEIDVLLKLPASLYKTLFDRILQPMKGMEPVCSCERPQTLLSCVTCQNAAVVEVCALTEDIINATYRYETAEQKLGDVRRDLDQAGVELAEFRSRHTGGGCGMGAMTADERRR